MSYGPLSHSNQISYVIDPDGSVRNVSHLTQAAASENAFSRSSVAENLISSKPTGSIRERNVNQWPGEKERLLATARQRMLCFLTLFPDDRDAAHSHKNLRHNNHNSTGSSII